MGVTRVTSKTKTSWKHSTLKRIHMKHIEKCEDSLESQELSLIAARGSQHYLETIDKVNSGAQLEVTRVTYKIRHDIRNACETIGKARS